MSFSLFYTLVLSLLSPSVSLTLLLSPPISLSALCFLSLLTLSATSLLPLSAFSLLFLSALSFFHKKAPSLISQNHLFLKLKYFLHFFHWRWLHSAPESPQHLLFRCKLQCEMKSEIKTSKIYLCAISYHTHCHKIDEIMHYSSINMEILFLSQFMFILSFSHPMICTP